MMPRMQPPDNSGPWLKNGLHSHIYVERSKHGICP